MITILLTSQILFSKGASGLIDNIKGTMLWIVLFTGISVILTYEAGFDNDSVYLVAVALVIISIQYKMTDSQSADCFVKANLLSSLLLVSVFFSGVSVFWSIFPSRTLIEWIQLVVYSLFFLLARKIVIKDQDKIVTAILIVAVGLSMIGIAEFIFISDGRIQATFTNPNPFGLFIAMMFLLSQDKTLRSPSISNHFSSILLLTTLFLSGSRASIAAMMVGLVVIYIGNNRKTLFRRILHTVTIAATSLLLSQGLIYFAAYIQKQFDFDKSVLESITRSGSFVSSSLAGRLAFWRVAWEGFLDRPLLGYGLGTFFSSYRLYYNGDGWYSRFTHNHYLQVLSELGIVGFVLFASFFLYALFLVIKNAKREDRPIQYWGICGALLAFMAHIMFDFTWNFPAVTAVFFVLLAFVTKGDESRRIRLHIPRVVPVIGLLLFALIVIWHMLGNRMYMVAAKVKSSEGPEKAIAITEKTNKWYPISTYGWNNLSDLYEERFQTTKEAEDWTKAFQAAEKAVKLSPCEASGYTRLANLQLQMNDITNAEYNLLKAKTLNTYHMDIHFYLGQIYTGREQTGEAINIYLEGLERAPHALSRVPVGVERDEVADTVAKIRISLYQLFESKGEIENAQEQERELMKLREEYPSVEKFFQ